ncbi:hypothetical protein UY3_15272 [Chelonia mydas]|uniref:Uncharacterized protein n=1 Tax=Chelonia mydas TaxID=8469 RepID=M7AQP4_CHEMY|nr:hypothetical protein UY3_15272 [Chelonia mydas]
MMKFKELVPPESREEFGALVEEGKTVMRTALQASLDTEDSAAWTVSSGIAVPFQLHLTCKDCKVIRIALPINAALLEPAMAIWQPPAASLPTCKRADRKYFIPSKGSEFIFTHPAPNSLVVDAVNQKTKHQFPCSTPSDKDARAPEHPHPPPQEVGCGPYPDSPTPNSPSAPDRAFMPLPPQNVDDFKQFQELFKRVALSQDIPLEEVQETQHRLFKILQPSVPSKIVLPINEALIEPADTLWQTPASILPTCKKAEREYYVPAKDVDFLFSHPQPNSLVVDAVTHWMKQPHCRPTAQEKDLKRLDLLGRKVYTSFTLQFRIANYSTLLASYDFDNFNKLFDFISHIPEDRRAEFKSVLVEG